MVNRYSNAGSFRYGFNGKEKDWEDYGEGNGYDYGARVYNSRLGRFFSADALGKKFPYYSPYQFAGNNSIWHIDLDGLEPVEKEGAKEEREELLREKEEYLRRAEMARSLKMPSAEEEKQRIEFLESELKKTPEERGKAFWNYINNGLNAAAFVLSPEEKISRAGSNLMMNKLRSQAFEQVLTSALQRQSDTKVARQVTLLFTGELNGQDVNVRIRVDNLTNKLGIIDLYEAKFSIDQISGTNFVKTLTQNQKIAFELFTDGTNINIFVRGNNGMAAGFKSGENIVIEGKVVNIKIVANNSNGEPVTIKNLESKQSQLPVNKFENKIE